MTYTIHGATGAQGAPIVTALVAAGKSVTALTRNPNATVAGARVASIDSSSVAELAAVYRSAEGVFVHLPVTSEDDRRTYARNVVAALREVEPTRVVVSTSGFPVTESAGDPSAISTLVRGLTESEIPFALVSPELFLENLLMPYVIDGVRERGVLPYALPAEFPVSWISHLDVADVVMALFERPEITGVVSVGLYPAITGRDLAEAYGEHFGKEIVYQALTPEEFQKSIAPIIGEGPAAGVAEAYKYMSLLPGRTIDPEHSAQKRLNLTPRNPSEWLREVALSQP